MLIMLSHPTLQVSVPEHYLTFMVLIRTLAPGSGATVMKKELHR